MAVFRTKDGEIVASDPAYVTVDEDDRLVIDTTEVSGRELATFYNCLARSIEDHDGCSIVDETSAVPE